MSALTTDLELPATASPALRKQLERHVNYGLGRYRSTLARCGQVSPLAQSGRRGRVQIGRESVHHDLGMHATVAVNLYKQRFDALFTLYSCLYRIGWLGA